MLNTDQTDFINLLLAHYNTEVLIKKERLSKHGDYRFYNKTNTHQITINGNLNQSAFFFVLIHEIAHRICFEKFKRKAKPHGEEWKQIFKELLLNALDKKLFIEEHSSLIHEFAQTPKSIIKINSALHNILFKTHNHLSVEDVTIGDTFVFRKKHYEKLEKKRTRYLCKELQSGRLYLFNASTPISETEKPQ